MDGAVRLASWQAAAAGWLPGGGGIRLRFEIFSVCFVFNIFSDFFGGLFFSFYLHLSIIDVCCLFVSCIHPFIAEFALISLIGVFFWIYFAEYFLLLYFFNIFIIYHMHDVLLLLDSLVLMPGCPSVWLSIVG